MSQQAKKAAVNTEDLILTCLYPGRDEAVIDKVRILAEKGIDWELFKRYAFSSGRYLIIYNRLKAANHENNGSFGRKKYINNNMNASKTCAASAMIFS